jgi:lysophospholipase L1-like esterase
MRRTSAGAAALTCAALVALAGALGALGAGATSPSVPRVTLIGDSVSDALTLDSGAVRILGQGVELNIQTQACRRLEALSCPQDNGTRPATALDLVESLGHNLGGTTILAVGYNDPETEYASELSDVVAALHKAGVNHILVPTLRAVRHPYLTMNAAILAEAASDPTITVVDWNLYSRSHPEWFQSDGLHLAGDGAQAMATLFHRWLVDIHVAPPPLVVRTRRLPDARPGRPYAARLAAFGGEPPYLWSATRLPRGFALTSSGRLSGTPRGQGTMRVTVRVTDAGGSRAARLLAIHLLP